jgi:hypothetical protein
MAVHVRATRHVHTCQRLSISLWLQLEKLRNVSVVRQLVSVWDIVRLQEGQRRIGRKSASFVHTASRRTSVLGVFSKLWKVTIRLVMSAPLFARMEQVDSHGKEFHEIWVFFENLQKIQFSLLTIPGTFMYIYDHIWPSSSHDEKCFRQKLPRKRKYMLRSLTSSPEIVSSMRWCRKIWQSNTGYRHTLRPCN